MFWITLIAAGLGVIFAKLGAMSVWLQVFKATTIFLLSAVMLTGAFLLKRAIWRRGPRNAVDTASILHHE